MLGRLFKAVVIPALVAGMTLSSASVAAAQAADPEVITSVGVSPVGTSPDDPNGGQWFYAAPKPTKDGYEPAHLTARIANPANVPQTIRLFLADVEFTDKGAPKIKPDSPTDVGAWGSFEPATLTVQPKSDVTVPFTVTAPANAEPGDHIGAVVAESAPEKPTGGNLLALVKRVAVRLYITIPGEASPNFVIQKIDVKPDSSFFPREATVTVLLRNTGRVRIAPTVLIGGKQAKGSGVLLTRSVEPYVVTSKVPLWGGPQRYRVDVATRLPSQNAQGPFRQASVSRFYVPWALLAALVLLVALVMLARRWLRKRGGRYAEMRADMKRIERLLAEQRSGAPIDTRDDDPEVAIKAAIKRAGRAGDKESEEKLKEKLAEHRAASAPPEPEPEPIPTPEPVVATAPQPEPEPEPAKAPAPVAAPEPVATTSYDWLLDDAPPVVQAEDPKDFYDSLRDATDETDPVGPPRTPVQSAMGPGYFVADPAPPPVPDDAAPEIPAPPVVAEQSEPTPPPAPPTQPVPAAAPAAPRHADAVPKSEHVDALATVLRELATAPRKRQEALLQAARSYGVLTLRAHADLIDQLPPDVRVKLLPKQWAI
jgi:hypothetical protein